MKWKKLTERLFNAKDFVDVKIICGGKTFDCHKSVLGCRSDAFAAMFLNPMAEANSGEVKIDDFGVDVIETMIYFIYNDEIPDKKKITAELLRAADKYLIADLVEFCIEHFMSTSFSLDSVLDILTVAHLINQKDLFDAASDFIKKNQGTVIKTNGWKQLVRTDPTLIVNVLSKIIDLQ